MALVNSRDTKEKDVEYVEEINRKEKSLAREGEVSGRLGRRIIIIHYTHVQN